jgi:monoamine oxidase
MEQENPARNTGRFARRTFLTAAGATALGTAVAGRASASAASADVIVIGAGFAGVTAARELRAQGKQVLLLEARDRIGGRTWSGTFAGQPIEYGGQWLGAQHTRVAAELRRYGIGLTPGGVATERSYYPTPNGPREFDAVAANQHLGSLVAKLFAGSEQYFPRPLEPFTRVDLLTSLDRLSLRDGINRLGLSTQDQMWLSAITSVYSGGPSTIGGLTSLAQWWALAGWNASGWDSLTATRPVGGMKAIIDAMFGDTQADLRLNTTVASITDDGSVVQVVTTTGVRYSAPAVIVAVPVNMWRTIRFAPGLPGAHTAATSQGMGVPTANKLQLKIGPGVPPSAVGTEGAPFSWIIPQGTLPDGDQLVVAFSVDPTLDLTDRRALETKLNTVLPGARINDYRATAWGRDRFARGGWGLRRPNQLITLLRDLQRPHGRIAFAGGDIAYGWNGGFIEGALETGERAAQQVLDLLG